MKRTRLISSLIIRVNPTSDKKKLSDGTKKSYDYGMVSVRKPELKEYVGQEVEVKIFKVDKKKKGKRNG